MTKKNRNKKLDVPKPDPWPITFLMHKGGKDNHGNQDTIKAIEKSIENEAPGIELDVCNIDGKLKIGHSEKSAKRPNALTLKDVLDFITSKISESTVEIPYRPIINLEIKNTGTAEKILSVIEEYFPKGWSYNNFIISALTKHPVRKEELRIIKQNNKVPIAICVKKNNEQGLSY